jgi:unsaturated rhamnogalacturonyl hydrolase
MNADGTADLRSLRKNPFSGTGWPGRPIDLQFRTVCETIAPRASWPDRHDGRRNFPAAASSCGSLRRSITLLLALPAMNPKPSVLALSFAVAMLTVVAARAQTWPTRDQILAKMHQTNDYFMGKWPDPGKDIVTDKTRPSNLWTRGTYYEGLMALYRVDPNARYYQYAVQWGTSHNWGLAYGNANDRVADDQCCGQTYLELYAYDPQAVRIRDIKTSLDGMVNSTKSDDWWWCDALHMGMPVFAKMGALTNDNRYYEKMYDLFSNARSLQGGTGLYNEQEHLWWRDATYLVPYKEPNGENCYWGRGNGWVFAALARVLDVMPAQAPHRDVYLQMFRDMAAALMPLQRPDGFWNPGLLDPSDYGGRELSGTAFIAYGLAWGINHGVLSADDYGPTVLQAWNAIAGCAIRPDGSLAYVQSTGKQPSDGQPITYDSVPNFEDYCLGGVLLTGAELVDMVSRTAVENVGIAKTASFVQTDAATVAPSGATPYSFEAFVRGGGLSPTTVPAPWRITLPDGATTRTLAYDATAGSLHYSDSVAATADLIARYPNGVYALTFANQTIPNLQVGAGTGATGDVFPSTPQAAVSAGTWSGGKLTVPASQTLTIATNTFSTNFSLGQSRVSIAIDGVRYTDSAESRAYSTLALTVPAFSLIAGNTYTVTLTFERTTSEWDGVNFGTLGPSATVNATFCKVTTFQIQALPETAAYSQKIANVSALGPIDFANVLIAGFTRQRHVRQDRARARRRTRPAKIRHGECAPESGPPRLQRQLDAPMAKRRLAKCVAGFGARQHGCGHAAGRLHQRAGARRGGARDGRFCPRGQEPRCRAGRMPRARRLHCRRRQLQRHRQRHSACRGV